MFVQRRRKCCRTDRYLYWSTVSVTLQFTVYIQIMIVYVKTTYSDKKIYQEGETMTSSHFYIILCIQIGHKVNIWLVLFIDKSKREILNYSMTFSLVFILIWLLFTIFVKTSISFWYKLTSDIIDSIIYSNSTLCLISRYL